jgi:hypothetical protein
VKLDVLIHTTNLAEPSKEVVSPKRGCFASDDDDDDENVAIYLICVPYIK